jgi:hypothetical protein
MHGRLVERNRHLFLETRKASQQAEGASVSATLIRMDAQRSDALLQFRAPSHAELRGTVWICCSRTPIFSPQPWWSILSDGGFVFSNGRDPEFLLYSHEGVAVRRVVWERDRQDVQPSRKDVIDYLYESARRTFAHAPAAYVRSLEKGVRTRLGRFPGAVSDTIPSLTQLVVDDHDRIWVRRFDRTRWPDGLSATWDVFDSNFDYLGYTLLPLDYVFEIKDGNILGTQIVHGALQRVLLFPLSTGTWREETISGGPVGYTVETR